ncbi:CCA tRNA nucleotidyltransferase [Persephonella sp.]
MLGIEKLLEKLLHRQNLPKEQREELDLDIKTKYVHGLLFYNTYFELLSKALGKETVCLIVGGWIRDRLLNRPIKDSIDVDFVVTSDPMEIVKRFRDILGKGDIFQFEKEKNVATIIFYEDKVRYRFDFSFLDISDIMSDQKLDFYDKEKVIIERIEQDLMTRDFTINAMGIVFDDALGMGASQTVLFDPSGGLEDLQKGIVRPVSFDNIKADPVRILRGYRIAQQLEFDVDRDFERWVKENAELISSAPSERVRDEILKIFENDNTAQFLEKLISVNLLEAVIPQIKEMASIGKTGEFHRYPLLKHSLKTVEYMEEFLKKKRL